MVQRLERVSWKPWIAGAVALILPFGVHAVAYAESPLRVVYPSDGYETTAAQIFLVGTGAPNQPITVNGEAIARSPAGHFAPSFPLQVGENVFTLQQGTETLTLRVVRQTDQPVLPEGTAFAEGSLTPAQDVAQFPDALVCFGAVAPPASLVSVTLGSRTVTLLPQPAPTQLPPNSAVLTNQNQPTAPSVAQTYEGCGVLGSFMGSATAPRSGQAGEAIALGYPQFTLEQNGQQVTQQGPGQVSVLQQELPQIIEVTAEGGTARTGPSTDYSRLTPLPRGTRAAVIGREANWYQMDYGAWIRDTDVRVIPGSVPPRSLIRGITSRNTGDWTEVRFPLQVPVPLAVFQEGDRFTLTLYNTTAQTDTIALNDDPVIQRLDWTQPAPEQIQYQFALKSDQQWGYRLRYEGTTLVLALRHPPRVYPDSEQPLNGITILLDPGHGGPEDSGSVGPNGTPEKDVALTVTRLLRDRLQQRGASIIMTRDADVDLGPNERAQMIQDMAPNLALSIHYNALPDAGDAENTAGVGTFWYQSQSHSLAVFLHNYLVEERDRPSYGVFWNNLALTRPYVAPAVLLELGFMINPNEFEWITNPEEQVALADTLADGITQWLLENGSR
ncbi:MULTISPECIES: N-acetylmuramoyl-L-alanine amidase [unclassified Leptolyngbya]|uniref:N-acetylmuramoyl-L-alanine amidase n=1 Tax=unclassified Leptolyngbya TaxID=2650499 RepID=UPI0016843D78|nr:MULTISPECIES: N-acetylmuramoyl-L-alanine amidase [unclassified Leptolyngbya]MBD1909282.1 N-acetylmuramoyl-L-alanine amidase [Leptolyngbya sp. FACHB-8]MBD2153512.1 N-acetylmuramoyl-L-alanine amidase [Leptolyngbya sp. FACHB-16]